MYVCMHACTPQLFSAKRVGKGAFFTTQNMKVVSIHMHIQEAVYNIHTRGKEVWVISILKMAWTISDDNRNILSLR